MINPGVLYVATHWTWSGLAVLLAAVLLGLHRLYGKDYLLQWAIGWCALAVYAAGSGTGLWLALDGVPSAHPVRLLLTALSVTALYAHLAWLGFGVREAASGDLVRTPLRRLVLAAAGTAGMVSSLLFPSPQDAGSRLLVRVGIPALAAGIVYLVSAWRLYRVRGEGRVLGRWLLTAAFAAFGLLQGHHFVVALIQALGYPYPLHSRYLGFAILPVQTAIGLSIVALFLEEERRRVLDAADRLEHLAYHDALTQLPNRQLFLDRLSQAVARAFRSHDRVGVLCLALDRYHAVNTSLGYAAGDELLRRAAERLRGALCEGDTLAKFSSAEFGLIFTGLAAEEDAEERGRKVADLFKAPFPVHGRDLYLTVSAGLCHFPGHGLYAEELLRNAHAALETAQRQGGGGLALHDPSHPASDSDDLRLESDLRRALAEDQFELHYQPYFELETGRVRGFEALLRWRHPDRGLLYPKDFLGLAETAGLGDEINLWSLHKALEQVAFWRGRGHRGLTVSVNLVARLYQSPELVHQVRQLLERHAAAPKELVLEITESLAMQNPEASLKVMRELHHLGVRLAIDDFGTGYSSLSYLRNFPIAVLKVDQSFIQRFPFDHPTVAIVEAVITLAHSLRLSVVAEGVETEEQRALLHKLHCDMAQGYHYSRPLEPSACEWLLREETPGRFADEGGDTIRQS